MNNVDYLIISTGRAASTAIYQYMNKACGLNLPWNKEPHYWCNIEAYEGIYDLLKQIHIKTEADYYELYTDSKMVMDASVGYFFCIDEVIQKLQNKKQKPGIIFLYREPVARAESLFNELKKKGLNSAPEFAEDVGISKQKGLWWEYYYDNVNYLDTFLKLESCFERIIAVNYAYFADHQKEVINILADFTGQTKPALEQLDMRPVNSSRDALVISKFKFARRISQLIPKRLIHYFLEKAGPYLASRQERKTLSVDVSKYLKNSIKQYNEFQTYINKEGVYVRRNQSK